MVKFTPRDEATAEQTFVVLAETLQRQLRCTDDAGWLSEHAIGVVLAGTDPGGARVVAERTCQGFGTQPPRWEVYSYPTEPGENGHEGQNGHARRSDNVPPARAIEPLFEQPMTLAKRTMDVLGAIVGLVLFAPVMLAAAIAVKVSSPGPIFYKQKRAGLGGRPFLMYKFRTMRVGAESLRDRLLDRNEVKGAAFKIKDDPRVTRVGRYLRRASIDELPQFLNVLVGDMSLVGPRPLPCAEAAACEPWQKERLNVTPGLTCICQTKGRSQTTFDDWMRMDVEYVEQSSLAKDLRIIAATVPAVLRGHGAY